MPELVRDGLRLHYTVAGEGSGVLLAHGMTGTGRADWSQPVPVLTPEFRCVAPDLRGHGASDFRTDAFSTPRCATTWWHSSSASSWVGRTWWASRWARRSCSTSSSPTRVRRGPSR